MTDLLLERITASSGLAGSVVGKIPFAPGTEPVPVKPTGGPLPKVPLIIGMWTTAEAEGFADVLTPGIHHTDWSPYKDDWGSYVPQFTGRSPAREEGCLAHWCLTSFNGVDALALKMELHVSMDGPAIPLMQLVKQIAVATEADGWLSGGTAGGVGESEVLGDIIFGAAVKANFAKSQWENESWAQQRIPATLGWPSYGSPHAGYVGQAFDKLIPAIVGDNLKIPKRLQTPGYEYRLPQPVFYKDVETVPDFDFADTADSFGIVKDDPNVGVEEMDDFCVAYALAQLPNPPHFMSCRNVSDPQMGGGPIAEQKKDAEEIYASQSSYWSSVCNALAAWGVAQDWS